MSLVKNTSFYTIGALLPRIGAFIFLPIYLKYLTPSEYGIVSSLHVLYVVLTVLFTLSLPRALYRVYYDYKSDLEKKKLFGTVFLSVVVFALLSLSLLFLFKNLLGQIYKSIKFHPYFTYAILVVFAQSFHSIPTVCLQIKEKAVSFISLSFSLFLIKSGLILWFLVGLKRGAVGYLEAELIAVVIFLPIYYAFIYRNLILKWDFQIFKNAIRFSLPIIPVILSSWILNLSDRVFIERYFSTNEVGIYSLGYKIAGLVLIFSIAFKKAYDPYFFKIANTTKKAIAVRKLFKINHIFIVVIILASFLISFFAREGIVLFFDKQYYQAINIIPIISFAYLISQNSALLNVMLYQEKKTRVVMYITITGAIINIGLNLLLIPIMGVYGAAWATVISFFLIFIFSLIYAKKGFFIAYNWRGIIPILSFLVILYFIFYFFEIHDVYKSLIVKILITTLIGVVLFFKHRNVIFSVIKARAN